MENLADLMSSDLSEQPDEALIAGYHDAVQSADLAADYCRQILTTLRGRHSWSELVKLTGDPQTTLYNRANPRRRAAQPDEAGE